MRGFEDLQIGLICGYRDLIKRGTLYFGTWVDVEGTYFDTAHFSDGLQSYPFKVGGCYLLLGRVEVDFSPPSLLLRWLRCLLFLPTPFVADEPSRIDYYPQ